MIMNFHPWEIDVDVDATRQFYEENDCAEDRAINQKFYDKMSQAQKDFFASIGVNIQKIKAKERIHEILGEEDLPGGKVYIRTLDFLFCGRFLSIPDYQQHIYSDEEITGLEFPDTLRVVTMPEGENLPVYDIDGWACVFKHPFFRMEECQYKKWDCGYVMGSILLMKDL